jgi:two-component system NarL family response regulator
MKIRILLIDDHKMMRDGLRAILERLDDVEIVGEAGDGRTALALVDRFDPDVVVMDIGMPDMNGIEATRKIHAEHERVRVVALSTHSDSSFVLHMLGAGASAYVLKDSAFEELRDAVLAVHRGDRYLSPAVTGLVVDQAALAAPAKASTAYEKLGAREREVLQLLAEGHTSAEIAHQLAMGVKTVESHRRNLMRKLDLHSVAALTKFAVREGLTDLES